jgi:hypothetical protein
MNDATKNDINSVVTDAQHMAGEFPIGRVIHVSTVTHAFRGELEAVTPSHYWLKKGTVSIIHDTGDVTPYSKSKDSEARESEKVNTRVRIPRGSIAWELEFES